RDNRPAVRPPKRPTSSRGKSLFSIWVDPPTLRSGITSRSARSVFVLIAVAAIAGLAPGWLPWFGTALAVDAPLASGDVALVLEGTGAGASDAAEAWRQQGLVPDGVVVEAPVRTHALVAYWSD